MEIGSDIECGNCGAEFNSKKNAVDRVMLEYELGEDGKIKDVKIAEHLKLEK
ncbi:MAG: hypothetical protein QW468_04575 [Candidatus Bathyarchaeia archaeon]